MIHPLPKELYDRAPQKDREQIDKVHEAMQVYFTIMSARLLIRNEMSPIHRIYLESWYGIASVDDIPNGTLNDPHYFPVRSLLKKGAQLMPTEHPVFDFLRHFYHKLYTEIMSDKECEGVSGIGEFRFPKSEILEMVREVFIDKGDEFSRDLEELCSGEETFDPLKVRDKYIARNINRTLIDGESGVLMIGQAHKVDQHLREMGSDIEISHLRV